jgi:peptidoglycan/LPS O-acetylase OafA/YrhL
MNWKWINIAYVFIGGALLAPISLMGLGTENKPPSISFIFSILTISFVAGVWVLLVYSKTPKQEWYQPTFSVSPFGPGRNVFRYFIGAVCLAWHGVCCMIIGGNLERIEWMGSLLVLLGIGLLLAMPVGKQFWKSRT